MSIEKLEIQEFLQRTQDHLVIDVRSPDEYAQAYIPGARSIPLFDNEERKIVGTAYKQQSREEAIKIGLDFFGPKMRSMVEEVENMIAEENSIYPNKKTILVHCWRGGMRSAGVAWLLSLYGYKVHSLIGGYKTYRNWVLHQFTLPWSLYVLGGYTGSGKTEILHEMQKANTSIVDLEKLANHKGSAFGAQEGGQPRQEMFENLLAMALEPVKEKQFWVEDESQRIGNNIIPNAFWKTMRSSPVYFVDIPFEERLAFIGTNYGKLQATAITEAIVRIKKRLGPLETKTALQAIEDDRWSDCFSILLKYYDKHYKKGLENREGLKELLTVIECNTIDLEENARVLLQNAKAEK